MTDHIAWLTSEDTVGNSIADDAFIASITFAFSHVTISRWSMMDHKNPFPKFGLRRTDRFYPKAIKGRDY